MAQNHDNTVSRKGKHLSYSEHCQSVISPKEGYSNCKVAHAPGRAVQNINNEVQRGTITQLTHHKRNEKVYNCYFSVFDADAGQAFYEKKRQNCGRRPKWASTDLFIYWADDKMLTEKWSPDVVISFAKKHSLFYTNITPGTTTVYQWIDRGITRMKNIHLLEKLSRKPKEIRRGNLLNNRILGKSIDKRLEENDTVVSKKVKSDAVLLTLAERQMRFEVILKLAGQDANSVKHAVDRLRARAGDAFRQLFKTVTLDNGSEFTGLQDALQDVAGTYYSPLCFMEARDERKPG